MPGYESDNWYGIFAPGGTPPALVKQVYDAVKAAAGTPAFRQRALSEGLEVSLETPDAAGRFVRSEEVKWRRVVKEQSITAE